MRAIQAMVWKEWRENAKWGVLAFIALSLAMLYSINQGLSRQDPPPSLNLFERTAPLTMFLVPLLASVLGLLQVAGELRRDQWAFLVHRPVSRGILFGGKAVAGLSLYFAATLLPMLLLALWMKTPGNLAAPFTWGLILAPLANILAGAAFYFAGMLSAIRAARWFGSRALGFFVAIGCLLGVNFVSEFWQALLFVLVSCALLGLAAWGSFLTTGTYERQPKIAKIALGITLFVSIAMVVGGLTMWAVTSASNRQRRAEFDNVAWVRTGYSLDETGRILRVTRNNRGDDSAVDLQGREIVSSQNNFGELEQNYLNMQPLPPQNADFRSTNRYYQRFRPADYNSEADSAKPRWFWITSQRRVVGYDSRTRNETGSIGPLGFTAIEKGVAAPFSEPRIPRVTYSDVESGFGEQAQYLRFPHAIYRLDLNRRTVALIYRAASAQPIQSTGVVHPYSSTGRIATVDRNVIRLLDPNGRQLFSTPLERNDIEKYSLSISATRKSDRFFLWYQNYAPTEPDHISEFSSQGVLLAKHTLPPLKNVENSAPRPSYWYETAAPIAEVPPVVVTAAAAYGTVNMRLHPDRFNLQSQGEIKLFWLGSLGAGLVWAILAGFVAKRCNLSRRARWNWTLAVFALGLFGLLLLLALRPWPTRVPCPNCGKKRDLGRERCEHCGAPFPFPPFDETSIFEEQSDETELSRALERV